MKIKVVTLVVISLMVLAGCKTNRTPVSPSSRPFTIRITNQSFYMETVDIKVSIDGKVITKGKFHVGEGFQRQHLYKSNTTMLELGTHTIHIQSKKGNAELVQEFEFTGGYCSGVVSFWYNPESSSKIPKFTFKTIDGDFLIL